jgi:hypothetical protein
MSHVHWLYEEKANKFWTFNPISSFPTGDTQAFAESHPDHRVYRVQSKLDISFQISSTPEERVHSGGCPEFGVGGQ